MIFIALLIQAQQLPPSPVKRIEIQPATRNITAGDSVRLAQATAGKGVVPLSHAA